MPDRLEHAAHLAVAPLVEHELDARGRQAADPRGSRRAVVQLDPFRERRERLVARLAAHLGHVGLLDPVAGVCEPVGERSVVRQQQDACRIAVEPADGDDPHVALDELDDRGSPARVTGGGDRPARLVEEHVAQGLLAELAPIDAHDVRLLDERVELTRPSVHRHPSGFDQLVGAASGRDTGAGEEGVEAHDAILASLPSRACPTTPT